MRRMMIAVVVLLTVGFLVADQASAGCRFTGSQLLL